MALFDLVSITGEIEAMPFPVARNSKPQMSCSRSMSASVGVG